MIKLAISRLIDQNRAGAFAILVHQRWRGINGTDVRATTLGQCTASNGCNAYGQPETGAINERSVVAISGLPIAFVATPIITS